MEGVKLLGFWGSPFSNRVELALKLKGVDYEYIEQEQDLANKSPLLLELNPVHKKIPVLVHNGKSISESLVIVEYIDETWPDNHPIFPHDPYEKAVARFWTKFIDEKAEEERRKMMEEVTQQLKALEEQLKGKKFFGGERIGIVDIAASFFGFWLGLIQEVTGLELVTKHKFPVLCN
ncbi:Glutathione S-transferase U8 [Linum perenne]